MNHKVRKHGNEKHRSCINASSILYIAIRDHMGTPLISLKVWIEVAKESMGMRNTVYE